MSLPGSYICPHCGVTVVFNPRPILRSAKAPYDASREFYQFGSVALNLLTSSIWVSSARKMN